MTISAPAVGTFTERTAEATTAVPYPASVAAGDLLVLVGSCNHASTATTLPSGWTQQAMAYGDNGGTAAVPNLFVATKIAAGSEGGTSLNVTHANTVSSWQILAASGVDQTTPLDIAAAITIPSAGGSTVTIPSQTVVTTGAALVYLATLSGSSSTATPPSGFTETGDRSTGTRPLTTGYKLGVSAGATGTVVVTFSGTGNLIGVLLVLRPAVTDTGIRIWNGSSWVTATRVMWSGSAWI